MTTLTVYHRGDPAAPALGGCQKVRGRRQRRCPKPATTVIEYAVPRDRLEDVYEEEGGYYRRVRVTHHELHRWHACRTHAQQACRNGAKAAVVVRG